jgi:hypothetical protein
MAEVLVDFDVVLRGPDGQRYGARAVGRGRADGMWEGWLEFPALDGGATIETGRETTQPDRDKVLYWATGLTDPYLDGALLRTLRKVPEHEPATAPRPAFDAPAERAAQAATNAEPRPILDPFAVYAEGDDVLRSQLGALSAGQLRIIVRGYALSAASPHELERMTETELVAIIMRGVEPPR